MRTALISSILLAMVLCLLPTPLIAGKADVLGVEVRKENGGTYAFSITVRHDDEGWKHYADRWEVMSPDGKVLGTRVLSHPHVNEQPFTRSLSGVRIPGQPTVVTVRAKCNVHGFGGREVTVDLSQSKGDGYEVIPLSR